MTDTTDNTPAPEARPEFNQLAFSLCELVRRQAPNDNLQKAEQRRRDVSAVMAKAATLFGEGRISAHDVARLHALRLRLDLTLPPPGELP